MSIQNTKKLKSALKQVFAPSSSTSMQNTTNDMEILQKEIFFNKKPKSHGINKSKGNENKVNPLNKQSKVSCCVIYDSKLHWANKCPHRNDQNNINVVEDMDPEVEECNILMIQNIAKEEIFVFEASKSAVVNKTCTKMIVGKQWFVIYKSNLTENTIKNIKLFPSHTKFKFGDGKQVSAIKKSYFPYLHCWKIM